MRTKNYLYGDFGDDKLQGNEGNDYLSGGWGNDVLEGGWGNDWLCGEYGMDVLYGFHVGREATWDDNDVLDGGANDGVVDSLQGSSNDFFYSF